MKSCILLKRQLPNLNSDQSVQQQQLNGHNCSPKKIAKGLKSSVLDELIHGLTEGPTRIGRTYTCFI
jgi:hypothetical protein